jgi:hypothetical protein
MLGTRTLRSTTKRRCLLERVYCNVTDFWETLWVQIERTTGHARWLLYGGNWFWFRLCDDCFVLGEELANGLGELGAFAGPVVDAIALEVDGGGFSAGVVGTDHFDRTAIAGAIFFDDNDAVVGLLTGANARQTNHQHRGRSSQKSFECLQGCRRGPGVPLAGMPDAPSTLPTDVNVRTTKYRGFRHKSQRQRRTFCVGFGAKRSGVGWEEEAEDVGEAGGPGGFFVEGAGDAEVVEVGWRGGGFVPSGVEWAVVPAALEETAVEEVGVAEMAEAFGHAHVEPDAEVGFGAGAPDAVQDGSLIPPDAGREDGGFAEDVGVVECYRQRNQTSERRTADGGVGRVGEGAEGFVDEGFELVDEEAAVAGTFAAAPTGIAGVGVLGHAADAGVGDADEDDGFDFVGSGEGVGGAVDLPGAVGDEGGAAVDEVLAVVEIEDGEATGGLVRGGVGEVGFGEVDGDVAAAGEEAGAEVLEAEEARVFVELAGLVFAGRERLEVVCGEVHAGGYFTGVGSGPVHVHAAIFQVVPSFTRAKVIWEGSLMATPLCLKR